MKKNNGYISAQAAAVLWNSGGWSFYQHYDKRTNSYKSAQISKGSELYKLNQKNATELKKIINNPIK